MTVVTFGGLTFDDTVGAVGYSVERLIGWYDAAPARESLRSRPQADGSFGVSRFYRDARVISVQGMWRGGTVADAFAARDALSAVQASGASSPFVVTDILGTRSSDVILQSAPQMDDGIYLPFFKFAFDVVAPDPRKYGPELSPSVGLPVAGTGYVWPAVWPADWGSGGEPGRVVASNAGTSATTPVLEVAGGLPAGFELTVLETGSRLRLERDIPASQTVFLNVRTGRAYLDGPANDISQSLTRRDWSGFVVPAGGVRTIQFVSLGGSSGTPRLTVRYAPAY